MGGALFMAAAYLGWRLYDLQVLQADRLQIEARTQRSRVVVPDQPRLTITDRNGVALAIDEPVYDVYAHPRLLKEQAERLAERRALKQSGTDRGAIIARLTRQIHEQLLLDMAQALAGPTGRSASDVLARLRSPRTVQLARGVSQAAHDQVRGLGFEGLEFNTRRRRAYPDKENSASVVGFVNYDGQGQGGIEQTYQKRLQVRIPDYKLPSNGFGQFLPAEFPAELLSDTNSERLALTIDTRLQRSVRLALEAGVKQHSASRGAAIVLDPRTGEVLALAVTPAYDNNRYSEYAPARFKNWAVSDLYEPGSTFKPINVAIALDAGAIQPNTTIYDTGSVQFGRYSISNFDHKARGRLSVTEVLKFSNNIGMIRLMQRVKPGAYYDRLKDLSITRRSGIDLPGETGGILTNKRQFVDYPVQAATVAFGQGIALTPLQLLRLHAAIANGGMLLEPRIVRALEEGDGKPLWQPSLSEPRRVFTEKTTREVRSMMTRVVQESSNKSAQVPGYRIAGKTGTAQKANIGGRGYLAGKKMTSFVGYLPAEAPQFVVLVVLDEPKSANAFGGTTAAPVVHDICLELIAYRGLVPSHPAELKAVRAAQAASTTLR